MSFSNYRNLRFLFSLDFVNLESTIWSWFLKKISLQAYKIALESLGHCEYAMKAGFHLNPKAIEASLQVRCSVWWLLGAVVWQSRHPHEPAVLRAELWVTSPVLSNPFSGLLQRGRGAADGAEADPAAAHAVWASHCARADRIKLPEGGLLQRVSCRQPETQDGSFPWGSSNLGVNLKMEFLRTPDGL